MTAHSLSFDFAAFVGGRLEVTGLLSVVGEDPVE